MPSDAKKKRDQKKKDAAKGKNKKTPSKENGVAELNGDAEENGYTNGVTANGNAGMTCLIKSFIDIFIINCCSFNLMDVEESHCMALVLKKLLFFGR